MIANYLKSTKLSYIIVTVLAVCVLIAPALIFSQAVSGQSAGRDALKCGSGVNGFEGGTPERCNEIDGEGTKVETLITNIINVISVIVGSVAVIMIIIGGFRYVTSGGSSDGISSAKNTILYAIVGLVIVAFAQIIVKFVLQRSTENIGG